MSNKKRKATSKNIKPNNKAVMCEEKGGASFFSKHRRSGLLMIGIAAVLLIAILSVGFALSWFAPRTEADITAKITDFSARTMISFDGENFEELTDTHEVNVGADGDIGDLRLNIEYEGKSSAYIRVQLFESFKQESGTLYPTTAVNYNLAEDWVYKDGYYYYTKPIYVEPAAAEAESTDESGAEVKEYKSIPFIIEKSSCTYNTAAQNNVYFNLVSVVEEVQPDRFYEFFGSEAEAVFGTDAQ